VDESDEEEPPCAATPPRCSRSAPLSVLPRQRLGRGGVDAVPIALCRFGVAGAASFERLACGSALGAATCTLSDEAGVTGGGRLRASVADTSGRHAWPVSDEWAPQLAFILCADSAQFNAFVMRASIPGIRACPVLWLLTVRSSRMMATFALLSAPLRRRCERGVRSQPAASLRLMTG